jgi:hypothetical protein
LLAIVAAWFVLTGETFRAYVQQNWSVWKVQAEVSMRSSIFTFAASGPGF